MILPPEFQAYFRDKSIKAAFISKYEGPNITCCDNCGGGGFFTAAIAIGGPFDHPPSKGTAHWGSGKWWLVVNHIAICPVCKNVKPISNKPIVPLNQAMPLIKELARRKHIPSDVEEGIGDE